MVDAKGFPADNDGFHDPKKASFKTIEDNRTLFPDVRYEPDVSLRNQSIRFHPFSEW